MDKILNSFSFCLEISFISMNNFCAQLGTIFVVGRYLSYQKSKSLPFFSFNYFPTLFQQNQLGAQKGFRELKRIDNISLRFCYIFRTYHSSIFCTTVIQKTEVIKKDNFLAKLMHNFFAKKLNKLLTRSRL